MQEIDATKCRKENISNNTIAGASIINNRKIELLAPAGDINSLKAALVAGADAVYLGGKKFGARAYAANFDYEQLIWARKVTQNLNKKIYITLNTIVFDSELSQLEKELEFYEALQPDAIIIQDLAVAKFLKKLKSKIQIHLSTQGSWFGLGATEFLQDLNIKRVILPRELSLAEIAEISKSSPFELEVFIHGAMCYSISGKCYWSVALGSRSGNRGTCAQPCRQKYKPQTHYPTRFDCKEFDYYFSPKDLRLISTLQQLISIPNVLALKIEGRMKKADYVYTTVLAYKTMLDFLLKENKGQNWDELQSQLENSLNRVFTRDYHEGFIYNRINENWNWNTKGNCSRNQIYLGKVINYLGNGLHKIEAAIEVKNGDKIIWNSEKHSLQYAIITYVQRDNSNSKHFIVRGLPKSINNQTKLFLTGSSIENVWNVNWDKNWEMSQIKLYWSGYDGQPLAVETIYLGKPIRITTEKSLKIASSKGLDEGILQDKFSNIGDDFVVVKHVTKALGKHLFIEPSELKKLKRNLAYTLSIIERSIIPNNNKEKKIYSSNSICKSECFRLGLPHNRQSKDSNRKKIFIRIWNEEFPYKSLINDEIYWILPLTAVIKAKVPDFINPQKLSFWVPPVLSHSDYNNVFEIIKSLHNVFPNGFSNILLCSNWEAFELKKHFMEYTFWLDWTFNVSNLESAKMLLEKGFMVTLSKEIPIDELPNFKHLNVGYVISHNPLISLSRFPKPKELDNIFTDSNGNKFFLLNLGNKVQGLYQIKDLELGLIKNLFDYQFIFQLDLALPHKETNCSKLVEIISYILSID